MTEHAYVRTVRDLYLHLPHTSCRFSRSDRSLACDLYRRGIPLDIVRSALLLATARRVHPNSQAPSLPTVRSLHYFLNAIDEVLLQPLPHGYVQYLQSKIAELQ